MRTLTAKRTADVLVSGVEFREEGEEAGLRASVMWCQKNAERASFVEKASADTLSSARCSGEK